MFDADDMRKLLPFWHCGGNQPCGYSIRRGGRRGPRGGGGGGLATGKRPSGKKGYASRGFSANSYLQSAVGGGEAGVSSGFGVLALVKVMPPTVTTAANRVWCEYISTSPNGGWSLFSNTTNTTISAAYSDGSALLQIASYTLAPSDYGRILFVVTRLINGQAQLFVMRGQAGADVAIATYTPATASGLIIGNRRTTLDRPAPDVQILSHASFRGTPTVSQIQDLYDATRALGDIPSTMDGATITHRYPASDQLLGAYNALNRKTLGLRNFTSMNFLSTPNGLLGSASGFAIGVHIVPHSVPSGTTGRLFGKSDGFASGWRVLCVNGALRLNAFGSAGSSAERDSPVYTITTADVGKSIFMLFVHDGTALRTYLGSGEIGSGTAITGYASPGSTVQYVGRDIAGSDASAISFFGGVTGHVVPNAAQAKAWLASCEAVGRIQPFTGAEHLYDVDADTTENGGVAPAVFLDRIGVDHLSRTDIETPKVGPNGIRGVGPYTSFDSWVSGAGGGQQGAASFGLVVDIDLTKVPTSTEVIVGCGNGSSTGFQLLMQSASLRALIYGIAASGVYTLTSGDLNKRLRVLLNKTTTVVQVFVNGAQGGIDVSAVGYTAPAAGSSMQVGSHLSSLPMNSGWVEQVQYGAVYSPAEITAAFADLTQPPPLRASDKRNRFHLDTVATPTRTPRISVERVSGAAIDVLTRGGVGLESVQFVESGPAAPMQLTDALTNSGTDELARTGVISAVEVTSVDGRVTKGVMGFPTNGDLYLEGTVNPFGSAAGLWMCWYGIVDTTGSLRIVNGTRESNVQRGFSMGMSAGNAPFLEVTGSGNPIACVGTALAAGDLGQPKIFHGRYTGGAVEVYTDGVLTGTPVAVSGFTAALGKWRVGRMMDSTFGALNIRVFGEAGGNGIPTPAQIAAHARAVLSSGRMVAMEGATTSLLHDFTTDIDANGGELPKVFQDRAGSCHLTRVGVDAELDANGISGVGPFSSVDSFQTIPGGGIQGANAMHVIMDIWLTKVPGTEEFLNTGSSVATTGYRVRFSSGFLVSTINGVANSSVFRAANAGDLNKRLRIIMNKTTTVLQLWFCDASGNVVQVGVDQPATSYNAPSVAFAIGNLTGSSPFSSGRVEWVSGGNSSLTPAEIATICADLSQRPPQIAGKTTKGYALVGVDGKLPARVVEQYSGADADALIRYGAPLQPTVRTERQWSYETSSILYGASTYSANDFFEALLGVPGDVGGFWGAILLIVRSQTVVSTSRVMLSQRQSAGPALGWNALTGTTNASIQAGIITASGSYNSPAAAVAASDVGKLLLFGFSYDAPNSRLRSYYKRAEIAGGTATAGLYTPFSAGGLQLGRQSSVASPAPADVGIEIYGFTVGDGVPTLAEFQSLHDSCMAAEDIQPIVGRSVATISLKRDVRGNGNVLPMTLVDRSNNGRDMTRSGSPLLTSQNARAFVW